MNRFVKITAASVLAIAASGAAYAEQLKVNQIVVKSELSDVTESNALEYYPTLNDDLKNAIAEQISGQIGDSIYDVEVNLKEISLDGAFALPESGEFNKIEAFVNVVAKDETIPAEKFRVTLEARSGVEATPGVFVMQPGTDDFYSALIDAFAKETADDLVDVDVPANMPTVGETNENG